MPTAHQDVISFNNRGSSFQQHVPVSDVATPKDNTRSASTTQDQPPRAILLTISLLYTQVQILNREGEEWWDSPLKRQQRRAWLEACNTKALTDLQVINRKVTDMIADMEALLGRFVRWTLRLHDGLEGLDAALKATEG